MTEVTAPTGAPCLVTTPIGNLEDITQRALRILYPGRSVPAHARGARRAQGALRRAAVRAVTHLDVDDAGVERAVAAFAEVVAPRAGGGARG